MEATETFLSLIRNKKKGHIRFETVEKYFETSKQKRGSRASGSHYKDPLKQRCSLEWLWKETQWFHNCVLCKSVMEIRRAMLLVLITTHNSLYECAGCWLCVKERMIILLHYVIQQRDTHSHPYSSTNVCNKEHDKLILGVHLTRLEWQDN